MWQQVFIGIGSNLGNRHAYYQRALEAIAILPDTRILHQSSQYETQPLGEALTWYLNGVIEIQTAFTPEPVLRRLQAIEHALGRVRSAKRWASRTIDLDLLFFDSQIVETPDLHIPHPELHNRRFVLEPLAEIAPHFVHPALNRTITELLNTLVDEKQVILLPKLRED